MDLEPVYDAVVIGTGSAGKPFAGELAKAGTSVLAIERGLVGGECAYLACIPSKSMLLSSRAHLLRKREKIAESDADAFARAIGVRDRTVRHRDDSHALAGLEREGVTVVRGEAKVEGRSVTVTAQGETRAVHWRLGLVLATGAEAVLPPIDGLADAPTWTSETALAGDELPVRLTILGGGAVGIELAQIFASFGTRVTLIEASDALLPREAGWLGEALARVVADLGVDVRTGRKVTKVEPTDGGARVHTSDGLVVDADRILVAVGKRPRTTGFGFDSLGIEPDPETGALPVDERCRVVTADGPLDDVFAIGDVTALAPYTHTANYHARLVAAHLLGHGYDADHVGIPRVVYTEPPVLCTGETVEQARDHGVRALSARFDATSTSRSAVERTLDHDDRRPAGLELVADADTGVLIGAAAIGPEADSWAAELALAVRARLTVHTLAQALHAFPSWTEAIHPPARELAERIAAHD
jgi:dihydrolipoamide dehydrogenase